MLITTFGWKPSESRADLYRILLYFVIRGSSFCSLHAHHCRNFHSHAADSGRYEASAKAYALLHGCLV